MHFLADSAKPLPAGLDDAAFDLSADPCSDFYRYACGGWLEKTAIPADRGFYARSFTSIAERNDEALRVILEDAAARRLPPGTPFAKQLGDFYATCVEEPGLELALPEVRRFLADTAAGSSAQSLARAIGRLHAVGYEALFSARDTQDLKDSSEVIASLDQGGLGLPDRDYYLGEDAAKVLVRQEYVKYAQQTFTLLGQPARVARRSAELVVALETRLARASQSLVERRDPLQTYHRATREGLREFAGAFAWDAYFEALGVKDVQPLNLSSQSYFREVAAIAAEGDAAGWRAYLAWVVLRSATPALPKAFRDASFAFTSKRLTGAREDRPRWKKCIAYTDDALGEALGREFVRRHFGEESKARTSAMVRALQASFEAEVSRLPWMDAPTKKAAIEKLQAMVARNKIGYPDRWLDYGSVRTARGSFFANLLEVQRHEVRRGLVKIGRPVDRSEWEMSPSTVNAYYSVENNEMVFPAGILQPPLFSLEATDAVNFGSIGVVVGHEITHGFDDEGRQFDANGNWRDWWTPASAKDFLERTECVKAQYSGYAAVADVKLNGALTLGENVADLGGLRLAHDAMRAWQAQRDRRATGAGERYDASQQFFLGFAQAWCAAARPEHARLRAATDPHAPAAWRVNGAVSNSEAFRSAFACGIDSKMVRSGAARCEVW
jgi:putative endopeptidase